MYQHKIGDVVITKLPHYSMCCIIPEGTYVTVTEIGDRGYGIDDGNGNEIMEIGWEI